MKIIQKIVARISHSKIRNISLLFVILSTKSSKRTTTIALTSRRVAIIFLSMRMPVPKEIIKMLMTLLNLKYNQQKIKPILFINKHILVTLMLVTILAITMLL